MTGPTATDERGAPIALLFATSGHSGVDRVVANLLPEFGKTDLRFQLLTIHRHGPRPGELPANVEGRRLAARHRDTALIPLIGYLRACRPRALLTASHRLNRAALLSRALARVDCHVAIRMGMSLSARGTDMGPAATRRLFSSMRYWYPKADAVIAPSAGVGQDLVTLAGVGEARLHVIPNPIVTPAFDELARAPMDDPWMHDPGVPVVLGVGSLEPRKDFATLIRAFARLRGNRRCRLVILGEGPQREQLARLAVALGVSEDVRMPGYESNPYRYMSRAAVFVLSSRREGSGAVLVEALNCATPVVSTDCPSGPAETLQQGRIGPLVPVGDAEAIARGVEHMLDRPPPRERLRAAAQPFDATASASRYLQALGVGDPCAR